MFNTSYVNAGVPVQFPRDGTGSFPIHLINAKREKCYTWRKYWSFRSWGNIKGYEREEDASERLLKPGKHIRKSAKQRFCIKNSPYTCLPSCHHRMVGSWVNGESVSKWIGYWVRTWLLGLRPLLPSLGTSSNRSGLSVPHFLNLIKGCCSTFAKCFESVHKKCCVRNKEFLHWMGVSGHSTDRLPVEETKPQCLTGQGVLVPSHYCSCGSPGFSSVRRCL